MRSGSRASEHLEVLIIESAFFFPYGFIAGFFVCFYLTWNFYTLFCIAMAVFSQKLSSFVCLYARTRICLHAVNLLNWGFFLSFCWVTWKQDSLILQCSWLPDQHRYQTHKRLNKLINKIKDPDGCGGYLTKPAVFLLRQRNIYSVRFRL